MMAEMRVRTTELEMVISKMGKRIRYYENPHAPPSQCTGYAWAIITDREVLIVISPSRSTAVFALHWPHTSKPFTADGYAGYRICEMLQHCWAHMLRDSRDAARGGPELESLHRMLQGTFS